MDCIVENLRTLQALAINASTDTNTNEDRATIQKEINQRLDEINDIASHTNFNGKYLLNGDYGKRTMTKEVVKEITKFESNTPTKVNPSITNTKTFNVTKIDDLVEPTETKTLSSLETTLEYHGSNVSVKEITENGVYDLAGFSGNLYISAENVKLTNSARNTLSDVRIITGDNLERLWLDNINIENNLFNRSVIDFGSTDKVLCLCEGSVNTFTSVSSNNNALIKAAGYDVTDKGLTIIGNGTLNVSTTESSNAAMIGGNYAWTCGSITIGSGVTLNVSSTANGAAIGSGQNGHCGDIIICEGANVTAYADGGAAIGSGGYESGTSCGNIYICQGATVNATGNNGAAIGAGWNGNVGDIYIYTGAKVTADGNKVAIGVPATTPIFEQENKLPTSSCDSIYIYSGADVTVAADSKIIGGYENDQCSYVYCADGAVKCADGSAVEYRATRTIDTLPLNTQTSYKEPIISFENVSMMIDKAYFQLGAKANQSTSLSINDMHTKSLRGEIPSRSDIERLNAMDKDSEEYSNFLATLTAANNMTLDDISVGTRENANVAICVIKGALEYALDVSTTLGAYSSRMEFAALNVTTMSENVQASESAIRDTDMAAAMTGYTKSKVLSQAAQSMLAQANQNGSDVISLLKS